MRSANPYWQFGVLSLGGAMALTLGISFVLNPLLAWLVAINIVAVATYRYDKSVAASERTRVPERVLLLLEAVGGTVGAAFAMWVLRPRHKTKSARFLFWFVLILLLQTAATGVAYYAASAPGK
jgi:uncharacterized membrane protein YsdA (DUF1294 family)